MFICRSRALVVVVAGVTILYSSKVCDLGMILNDRLTFDDHINDLWCATEYISSELELRLAKALVIPQFLFGDVLFRMTDSTGLRKLQVAFNNCVIFFLQIDVVGFFFFYFFNKIPFQRTQAIVFTIKTR
jgi:hypothetical protein